MPKAVNPLASWDSTRQTAYRQAQSKIILHVLLDASGSMCDSREDNIYPATALRRGFNLYLTWLKTQLDPLALMDIRCFSGHLDPRNVQGLHTVQPLTERMYDPTRHGSGTALYAAIGDVCSTTVESDYQHILVVFTDGEDTNSEDSGWTLERAKTVLTTLVEHDGWLAVFLGAFPESLEIGKALGFAPGNCLTFPTDQIPEAFERLTRATQRYLASPQKDRKLLAQQGVF